MRKATRGVQTIPNVERAFKVLELVSEYPDGLRFSEVAAALGMAKSSSYVLLENLAGQGYVDKDENGRYRMTLRMFQVGSRVLKHLNVRGIALPFMVELQNRTGFPVHLAVLDDGDVVYLEKVEGTGFVRFDTYVGKRAPVHLTAVGKALVAWLPDDELDRLIVAKGLGAGTEKAIRTPNQFREELAAVRRLGYSLDDEEEVLGVRCIGAPVRDHTGRVIAAVSIIGLHRELPAAKFPEFGAMVVELGRQISTSLGCPGAAWAEAT